MIFDRTLNVRLKDGTTIPVVADHACCERGKVILMGRNKVGKGFSVVWSMDAKEVQRVD